MLSQEKFEMQLINLGGDSWWDVNNVSCRKEIADYLSESHKIVGELQCFGEDAGVNSKSYELVFLYGIIK